MPSRRRGGRAWPERRPRFKLGISRVSRGQLPDIRKLSRLRKAVCRLRASLKSKMPPASQVQPQVAARRGSAVPANPVKPQQPRCGAIVLRFDWRPDDQAVPRDVRGEASQSKGPPILVKRTGSDLNCKQRTPSRPGTDERRSLSIPGGSGCSRRNRSRVPRGRAFASALVSRK
jgi:hypothetical protein